ncbi:P44/Msp2 family outer membrane protein [Ehrlichia canis]|uniref:Surface antigen msp4 n=1 Tax=Ehrlichia canis (strain Jake) TaxID=269484 RepID=A0ACA6AX22_EHRCJ|nr:P44/Msp2 family outer membrane protein [Ehrlichia canis]AAZ68939.1 Surface antigen msp4 [Ehrlichia canis str. Jake]
MNNKSQFLIRFIFLTCMLSLPNISLSKVNNEKHSGLYISGQYKPSVSVFSNFSVKETNFHTKHLIALKQDVDSVEIDTGGNTAGISNPSNFTIPYTAEFQDNHTNCNGSIGYAFAEGPRIEIELSYEKFDVKNPTGYTTVKDAYRYFALAREINISLFQPKQKEGSGIYHVVMKNDGLSILSNIVNICYDFSLNNLPISPYLCGGMGINAIEFFDALHVKFAYQSKAGISYQLLRKINLFIDVYYYQVISNKFKNLKVQHVHELKDNPKVTSAVATLDIAYFGSEAGIRIIF